VQEKCTEQVAAFESSIKICTEHLDNLKSENQRLLDQFNELKQKHESKCESLVHENAMYKTSFEKLTQEMITKDAKVHSANEKNKGS